MSQEQTTEEQREEKALAELTQTTAVANPMQGSGTLGLEGLENFPSNILPIPFVKLVQPQSQNVTLADGSEAQQGTFYFNEAQQAFKDITFVILRAKYGHFTYEVENEVREGNKVLILGLTTKSKKPFILPLSSMSFSNFGRIVAAMREQGAKTTWEFPVKVTSEMQTNKKGKFYVAKFELQEKLSKEDQEEAEAKRYEFGTALDRDDDASEVTPDTVTGNSENAYID